MMGRRILYIKGQVKGPKGKRTDVKFLVDSGATYSVLPKDVWQALGLEPKRKMTFTLADGTTIERSISEAYFILPQGKAHTPVVLGEDGDEALLGVVTLEILGLVFNPFDRTLQPMRIRLSRIHTGFNNQSRDYSSEIKKQRSFRESIFR
jgi:clan AA aspartic protease